MLVLKEICKVVKVCWKVWKVMWWLMFVFCIYVLRVGVMWLLYFNFLKICFFGLVGLFMIFCVWLEIKSVFIWLGLLMVKCRKCLLVLEYWIFFYFRFWMFLNCRLVKMENKVVCLRSLFGYLVLAMVLIFLKVRNLCLVCL